VTDEVLAQAPLFAALDDQAAAELRASMLDLFLPRGESLFTEGDPGDRLYLIVDGKIKLGATSGDGRETLLAILYSEGVAKGRITLERMVDLLATTPARRFGLASKGAIEVGRDGDVVLFDTTANRTIRAAELHHTSDYTPYEGLEVNGAVRDVLVRGRRVISDGAFVGRRGAGRYVERGAIV